jgi:hypothetical protein
VGRFPRGGSSPLGRILGELTIANRTMLEPPFQYAVQGCMEAFRAGHFHISVGMRYHWPDCENVDHPLGVLTIEDHSPLTDA